MWVLLYTIHMGTKFMPYANNFLKAIDFRNDLFKNEEPINRNVFETYAKTNNIPKINFNEMYEICLDFMYFAINNGFEFINQCHTITDKLKICLQRNGYSSNEIAVTIGDVAFKNKRVYGLNEEKLIEIIKKGKDLSTTLDLHVWLTYKTIYVFDLTITPDLLRHKIIPEPDICDHLLMAWHDNNKWELEYYPILVDNEFYNRVDGRIY